MCRLYIFQQNNSMQWNRKVLVHIDSGEALEMYGKLRNIETDLPRMEKQHLHRLWTLGTERLVSEILPLPAR